MGGAGGDNSEGVVSGSLVMALLTFSFWEGGKKEEVQRQERGGSENERRR